MSLLGYHLEQVLMDPASLPRWIAYWTMGFEMTTQWYFRRIRRLFSLLSTSSKGVLPANRKVVSSFMRSSSIYSTQYLLSGLRDIDTWDHVDWVNDSRFLKFKDWVVENERRMLQDLRKLEYYIDQDNTLSTVTRGSRPEMVGLQRILRTMTDKRLCFSM